MLTALVVGALVLGGLGLVAGLLALRTLGRLRRSIGLLGRGSAGRPETFLEAAGRHADVSERTRAEFAQLNLAVAQALAALQARVESDLLAAYGSVRAEVSTVRADVSATRDHIEVRVADVDTRVDGRLSSIKKVVEAELAQIRARFQADHQAAVAANEAEQTRRAEDDAVTRAGLRATAEHVDAVIAGALRRIALVRFDAFHELAGRLSFALALLDGHGDGIVLSSLAGRTESRLYAKPVNRGEGVGELSPEEREAVAAAMSGP